MVGEDTHLTGRSGDVDLGPVVAKIRQYSGVAGDDAEKRNEHAGRAVDSLQERTNVSWGGMEMERSYRAGFDVPGEAWSGTA